MNKETVLQEFGLTDAEVKAYITLLQFGESTASDIAQKTGKNRTFTYDRLKKLANFGLVSSIIKDHKKYFVAAEPTQLLSILREREEKIQGILPELITLRKSISIGPEVEVYSSGKGIQTALNLTLSSKLLYLHGSIQLFEQTMPTYFSIWNNRRIKAKIPIRILSSEHIQLALTESDLLSEEEKSVTSTFTFDDKTLLVMWGDQPVAILIKSREVAINNISFFNTIWNREVKIYSGTKGIQRAFLELLHNTKEFVGFGYSKDLSDVYTVEFSNKWHELRIHKKITSRIIAFEDEKTRSYYEPREKQKRNFNVRFLERTYQGPACISLSDTTVATFVYTEKKFRVIVNKNKETVQVYKKYFEELWNKAKD